MKGTYNGTVTKESRKLYTFELVVDGELVARGDRVSGEAANAALDNALLFFAVNQLLPELQRIATALEAHNG